MCSGYSGKPLVEKLGIKEGYRLVLVDAPPNYESLLGELPEGTTVSRELNGKFDIVQLFAIERTNLQRRLKVSIDRIKPNGMIWVSWPKGKSNSESGLHESDVRAIGLRSGLVDVKICAVDETWSALKFVKRLKNRQDGCLID